MDTLADRTATLRADRQRWADELAALPPTETSRIAGLESRIAFTDRVLGDLEAAAADPAKAAALEAAARAWLADLASGALARQLQTTAAYHRELLRALAGAGGGSASITIDL